MTDLANRGPLGQKTGKPAKKPKKMRQVSVKKAAYRRSQAGQEALRHMERVKGLPCVICAAPPPSIAHHCMNGRYGTRKTSDFDTIPLCSEHHDYPHPEAFHSGKETWAATHGPDYGFLPMVRKMLGR